ncbi:PAS domain S-box protein [Brevibacillus migulae]|uniref:PAS domain S-box protein n=1 Tax=Brevibacillus migulae TaxID=1644114 RepID=UPI001430F490|nr:PAS domain S-box protein [Brevibacillus migulae]
MSGHTYSFDHQLILNAIQYSPIGMALLSAEGKWLMINRVLCSMLGYTENELMALSLKEITHPEDIPLQLDHIIAYQAKMDDGYQVEKRLIHKKGYHLWTMVSASIVKDENQEQNYIFMQVINQTEQKRSEAQNRERQQRYQSLFLQNPDLVYSLSVDGTLLSVNAACEQITGYRPDELFHITPLVMEEDINEITRMFHQHAQESRQHYEICIPHKKGHFVHLSVTNIPIVVDGEMVGIYGVAKDISEQVNLLKRLTESEQKYRFLAEHSLDMIVVFSPDCIYQYVSPACKAILGYEPVELIGVRVTELLHPEDCFEPCQQTNEWNRHGDAHVSTFRYRKKDGSYIWIEAQSKRIRDPHTQAVIEHVSVFRDVTERKREQEEFRRAQELLRTSEKLTAVGQMAAGIAHEIRNPLTSLKGFLQVMKTTKEEKDFYYEIMESELNRIQTILNELLFFAKPKQPSYERTCMQTLVAQVTTLLESQAILTDAQIQASLPAEELYVSCDQDQIKQVFINMIKNGLEAMVHGGILTIAMQKEEPYVHIRITDQGPGIPPELIHNLGQPFFTTKETGTGLGLSISYSIIEAHMGKIAIESTPGEGTTFTISLPLA